MSAIPPARREESSLVVDTIHELHPDHRDPQQQTHRQNVAVALLPLALIAFGALVFVAAAWTIVVAK
jgi:hypothetical protein